MPPQQNVMMKYIGAILTGLCLFGTLAVAFGVQGEKVTALEQKTMAIENREEKYAQYNTEEHKAILTALADIKAVLRERRQR